jgi:hypothetical protein
MSRNIKLTSVNILEDIYTKFKVKSIEDSINLQKFVNRAIDLYNNDIELREKIKNHKITMGKSTKF